MPRKRNKENQGLPKRWIFEHGAYFYRVPPGLEYLWDNKKKYRLGESLAESHREYSARMESNEDASEIVTFNDAIDRYVIEEVPNKAPKTQLEYLRYAKKIKSVFGDMRLIDFKPKHAYMYRDMRGKTAPRSADLELGFLSHVFTMCIKWGVLDSHPMIEGKFRKDRVRTPQRYVEDWEIIEALSIKPTRKRGSVRMCQAYIKLKLLTGMRRTDLLKLRVSDIDERGIHITPSKTLHSSGKSTIYEWDSEGLRSAALAECIDARPVISPYVFCNKRGEPYHDVEKGTANGFDSVWRRFMDRVLAETHLESRFTERQLRNKCGSDANDIEQARALLSHTTTTTTNKHYRLKPENVGVSDKIRNLLQSKKRIE